MSDGRFSATLLWVRQGAGPEMDCPHSLFELSVDDGHPRTLDHHQCRRLLKPALLDVGVVHRQALETADVFQAFAVFALLLQRKRRLRPIGYPPFAVTAEERVSS